MQLATSDLKSLFHAVPKVELHLHLEGAIPLPTLWSLIVKYGGDASVASEAGLKRRLSYETFQDFIDTWIWKNGFLREAEDFTTIAEAAAQSLVAQNIHYAETFFSPARFDHLGLGTQRLIEAARAGLDRVPDAQVALIPDLVRDLGPDRATRTLEEIAECRDLGVVGVGMGGSEHKVPPAPFAPIYAAARDLGFGTTAHAGEAAGADSVRGVIEHLKVERIGHGIRAEEDPAVLDLLAEQRIPLEICPLSNVATGVVPAIADHPVRRFWERGLTVTINTDDPGMFHNSLADEYMVLHEVFGFTLPEIGGLILAGVDASWQSDTDKAAMRDAFQRDPAWAAFAS